jgi:arylsulfatase A-like enzyme
MSADEGQPPGTATRPNVLFVICDQLRADHLGFAGNPEELTNLAVHQRDPAARAAAIEALVEEMTRADDITRPESTGTRARTA